MMPDSQESGGKACAVGQDALRRQTARRPKFDHGPANQTGDHRTWGHGADAAWGRGADAVAFLTVCVSFHSQFKSKDRSESGEVKK